MYDDHDGEGNEEAEGRRGRRYDFEEGSLKGELGATAGSLRARGVSRESDGQGSFGDPSAGPVEERTVEV